MSDNQNEELKGASKAEQEKLLAIRDIIFGNEIQEYNKEFETLKDLIDKNKAASDNANEKILEKINTLEKELKTVISGVDKKLSEELAELRESKTDRKRLGDLLEELGKSLKA